MYEIWWQHTILINTNLPEFSLEFMLKMYNFLEMI